MTRNRINGLVNTSCIQHLIRRLQTLYMVGACAGPPRPLLAHWPRWRERPWGTDAVAELPGHLRLPPTSAHFVQVPRLQRSLECQDARHLLMIFSAVLPRCFLAQVACRSLVP